MELSDIIDAILFKCVESRGYYQDIGVLADSVAGRVLSGTNNIPNMSGINWQLREYRIYRPKFPDISGNIKYNNITYFPKNLYYISDLMYSVTISVRVFPVDFAYFANASYIDASRRNTIVLFGSLLFGRPAPGLRPPRLFFIGSILPAPCGGDASSLKPVYSRSNDLIIIGGHIFDNEVIGFINPAFFIIWFDHIFNIIFSSLSSFELAIAIRLPYAVFYFMLRKNHKYVFHSSNI